MSTDQLLNLLINMVIVLVIFVVIFFIFYIVVKIIMLPIERKKAILDKIDQQKEELDQILIQKGIEWDRYKQQSEELDKLRKSYQKLKSDYDTKLEEKAKVELHVENLKAVNKQLKESSKEKNSSSNSK